MACITLMAQPMAMATTQLARMSLTKFPLHGWNTSRNGSLLRMNWVVVTDKNGGCSLRMRWQKDAD